MSQESERAILRRALGAEWLDPRVEACRASRMRDRSGGMEVRRLSHPLVEDICDVDEALDPSGGSVDAVRRIRVVASGASMAARSNVGDLPGLEQRIGALKSDPDSYFSLVFEFAVAEALVRDGHAITFVPESTSGDRTHDLLVNGEVEVECKETAEPRKQDKAAREQWRLLFRRSVQLASRHGAHLQVDFTVAGRPSPQLTQWAIRHVAQFLQDPGLPTSHSRVDGTLVLGLMNVLPSVNGFRVAPTLEVERSPHVWEKLEMTAQGSSPTTVIPHSSCNVTCRTLDPGNWTSRVRRAIADSAGQFSGRRPALVVVAIPEYVNEFQPERIDDAKGIIRDFLRSHPSVSGVSLVKRGRVMTPQGPRPVQTWITEASTSARHPLPEWLT